MSLNLADCVDLSAMANPDRIAVVMDDYRMSYGELAAAAKRVANLLRDKGIGRGDVVAMMLPNTPHFPIIYYGILYAGAIVLPMNPILKPRGIAYQLRDCGAKALFAWHDCVEDAARACEQSPSCRHLVAVEPTLAPIKPAAGESFVKLLMAVSPEFEMVETQADDTAVIIYTSSLGEGLYGAELSHFNLFQNAFVLSEYIVDYHCDDVFLGVLPLFHAFGQTTMMNAVFIRQGSVVLVPRFDPQKIMDTIAKQRVTVICLVPTMLYVLLEFKKDQTFDVSSLRCITTGGAAMSPEVSKAFTARFGVPVLEGYGLTETGPVVTFNKEETNRLGSIGRPIWGCRLRIMREDGSFAETDEVGEIVLRGHNVMKGYLNQPEANARVFAHGWFHTGDLGYIDADGFTYITGRKKDIIIRSGMNIYPWEVEEILKTHPAIQEAAVVGIPDPMRGEEPKAFVVLKPNATVTTKDLATFCRHELASYKCPRVFELMDTLPHGADGKILKDALRNRACSVQNRLPSIPGY